MLFCKTGKLKQFVQEISKAAQEINNGNYSARVSGIYKNELLILKNIFNSIAQKAETHADESGKSLRILQNNLKSIDANNYINNVKRITKEEQEEEKLRMRSVLLASLNHEIRNPMHGIIGFTELALDDDIKPNTRNYLTNIKTNAESLLMIIDDTLKVIKTEKINLENNN